MAQLNRRTYAPEKPCEYCGTLFSPRADLVKRGWGRCCSRDCANHLNSKPLTPTDAINAVELYQTGMTIREVAAELKAPWKRVQLAIKAAGVMRQPGQQRLHAVGYMVTYAGENGSGRTFVHRVVAAETIGRGIAKDEVVHHVNLNKTDNRPENLAVVVRKRHGELHAQLERLTCQLLATGLMTYSMEDGYIFSSEMEEFLNYVSQR